MIERFVYGTLFRAAPAQWPDPDNLTCRLLALFMIVLPRICVLTEWPKSHLRFW